MRTTLRVVKVISDSIQNDYAITLYRSLKTDYKKVINLTRQKENKKKINTPSKEKTTRNIINGDQTNVKTTNNPLIMT